MHRLALGAFRLASTISTSGGRACLNAPFGARCFLAKQYYPAVKDGLPCLNAPFGARCFLTERTIALNMPEAPTS